MMIKVATILGLVASFVDPTKGIVAIKDINDTIDIHPTKWTREPTKPIKYTRKPIKYTREPTKPIRITREPTKPIKYTRKPIRITREPTKPIRVPTKPANDCFDFTKSTDGFVYRDNTFGSAGNSAAYASGRHINGGLGVWTGGKDNVAIKNMSGGWVKSITVPYHNAQVRVRFQYRATLTGADRGEFVQAVAMIAGRRYNLITLHGNGSTATSGLRTYTAVVSGVSAGHNTITLGAFMNHKNASNEQSDLFFDNVCITFTRGPPVRPTRAPTKPVRITRAPIRITRAPTKPASDCLYFTKSAHGFSFHDDTFHTTNSGMYASGRHVNGQLAVWVGGKDSTPKGKMSGGWVKRISVPFHNAQIRVSVRCRAVLSAGTDKGEYAQVTMKIAGKPFTLATLHGRGAKVDNGIKTYSRTVGNLAIGTYPIILGALMSSKNASNEQVDVFYDRVCITITPGYVTRPPIRYIPYETEKRISKEPIH